MLKFIRIAMFFSYNSSLINFTSFNNHSQENNMTTKNADIGLVGLAVMGQNLALNIADHGYTIAVYNRDPKKMVNFIEEIKTKL